MEINPEYAEGLNNLGTLKVAQQEWLEAVLYLKKAIQSRADYADPYFNLAVVMEQEGNVKNAVANYKKFLEKTNISDEVLLSKVRLRIEELVGY